MKRHLGKINKPLLVAYLIMGIGFSWQIDRVEEVAKTAKELGTQREIDSIVGNRINCESDNRTNEKLRALVIAATSGRTGVDYTALPEFKALPMSSKIFFRALRAKSLTEGNAAARAEFLKGLDDRDCKAEFPYPPHLSRLGA